MTYIAGRSAEQTQRPRSLLASLLTQLVGNGPGRTTDADLPPAQLFPSRPAIDDAVVPSSTGSELLPGRIRSPGVGDGEPGATNPVDFDF